MGDKMHDLYADDGTNGLSRDDQQREKAARAIQSAALKRVIGGGVSLDRKNLLARIMLEQKLRNGLLSLLLTFTLLSLVVYSAILESDGPSRIGLMSTLESVFSLDDSLAEIKTLEDLKGYTHSRAQRIALFVHSFSRSLTTVSPSWQVYENHFLPKPRPAAPLD